MEREREREKKGVSQNYAMGTIADRQFQWVRTIMPSIIQYCTIHIIYKKVTHSSEVVVTVLHVHTPAHIGLYMHYKGRGEGGVKRDLRSDKQLYSTVSSLQLCQ